MIKSFLRKFDVPAGSPAGLTFACEMRRAVATGILETASTTFLLLVAVRWFQMGPTEKALLAGGGSIGLVLGPLAVFLVSRSGLSASRAAAVALSMASLATLLAALLPFSGAFVLFNVLALSCINACVPLYTHIYQDNYPAHLRGRLFARSHNIRIATSIIFAALAGYLLDGRIEYFQLLLGLYSICFAYSAWNINRIPSQTLNHGRAEPLAGGFAFLLDDAFFRNTLINWMLLGFGNLMMWPLRVEYLASSRYGLELSTSEVALLVAVLPNVARLLINPLWGRLFDRLAFRHVRLLANLSITLAIPGFFMSHSFSGLCLSALIYGIGNAGGDITWNLWTTKCAPPGRTAAYMSVHTFFTGLRGITAPLLGFHLITAMPISHVAWISVGLMLAANIFLFLPSNSPTDSNNANPPEPGQEL